MLVDCHRHLGGSVPVNFVWDMIQTDRCSYLAESHEEVARAMTFGENEPRNFHRFLDKFKILDDLCWDAESLEQMIRFVCADLVAEGVDYTWMRCGIGKYVKHMGWHRSDVVGFIKRCFDKYVPGRVGIVLSLQYESPRASQRQLAKLIEHPDVFSNVVGIDLVGDEAYFDEIFYAPLLREWRDAGKVVMAHVGESQPVQNVIKAVQAMGVTDVNHGLAVAPAKLEELMNHDLHGQGQSARLLYNLLNYYRDHDICFHMAITSNYLTGSWLRTDWHPIMALLEAGVKVTIGTDDPTQCATTMQKEYGLLPGFGVTPAQIDKIKATAIERTAPYRITHGNAIPIQGTQG